MIRCRRPLAANPSRAPFSTTGLSPAAAAESLTEEVMPSLWQCVTGPATRGWSDGESNPD